MLSKVSQGESQLHGVGLPDRDSERVVEPFPQVAVGQQVEAQHNRQVGKGGSGVVSRHRDISM